MQLNNNKWAAPNRRTWKALVISHNTQNSLKTLQASSNSLILTQSYKNPFLVIVNVAGVTSVPCIAEFTLPLLSAEYF